MQIGQNCSTSVRATKSPESANLAPLVLIVDDDVSVRESLDLLIATELWRADTFASSTDFLAHPRAAAGPCRLLLDVALSGLSGLELQRQLAHRVDMPIIFITGYGDVPTTVQAMKAGLSTFSRSRSMPIRS